MAIRQLQRSALPAGRQAAGKGWGRRCHAGPCGERPCCTLRPGEPLSAWRWKGAVSIPPLRRLSISHYRSHGQHRRHVRFARTAKQFVSATGIQREQRLRWKKEAPSMKQIYWGCWSLFIPSLFIKWGPPANIFPPTVSKLEIFPSLQLGGPLAAGSGGAQSLGKQGTPTARQALPGGRQKTLSRPFTENGPRFYCWSDLSGSSHRSIPAVPLDQTMDPAFPARPRSLAASCSSERSCKPRGVRGRRLERAVFTSWCE